METTRTMDIAWRERKLLDWRLRSQYNSVIKGHWKWLNSRSAQRCHSSWLRDCKVTDQPGGSAGFWLGGSMPPCRLWRRKFRKFDYEMVHSEVYLNKYVVSITPFSTSACPDCSQDIQKTALFCMFSLYNFSSIFPGGQLTPFVSMCGRPCDHLLCI